MGELTYCYACPRELEACVSLLCAKHVDVILLFFSYALARYAYRTTLNKVA